MLQRAGAWVWRLNRIGNGHSDAVELAQSLDISRLYVKLSDGRSRYKSNLKLAEKLVPAAKDAGIEVGGWSYNYDHHPDAQGKLLGDLCQNLGIRNAILNCEKEFQDGGDDDVTLRALIESTREYLPRHSTIGVSSFKYPRYFPKFPWHVLTGSGVLAMPQNYFYKKEADGHRKVRKSLAQWSALGAPVQFSLGGFDRTWSKKKGGYVAGNTADGIYGATQEVRYLAGTGGCLPSYDWWKLGSLWHAKTGFKDAVLAANLGLRNTCMPAKIVYRCPLTDSWYQKAALLRLGYYSGFLSGGWGPLRDRRNEGTARYALVRLQQDSDAYDSKIDGVWGPKSHQAVLHELTKRELP